MKLKEDIHIELKEFFINSQKNLKFEEYEEAIISGKMYSNSIILESLEYDFSKYIGKYLSGWNHSDLSIDEGHIYFGVKDNGNITGIPFNGELTKELISNLIFNCAKTIKCKDVKLVLENIGIDIIPIKPKNYNLMKKYKQEMDRYYNSIKKHKESMAKYLEWHKKSQKWHCKLVNFLNENNKKEKFLKWIKENCNSKYKDIIIKEIIEWKNKEDFNVIINEEIKKPNTLLYWLAIFKDLMNVKIRPKPVISQIYQVNLKKIYHSPYLMNYHINQQNSNINFYMIKLILPNLKEPIYTTYNDKWIQYKRINGGYYGPSSVPL